MKKTIIEPFVDKYPEFKECVFENPNEIDFDYNNEEVGAVAIDDVEKILDKCFTRNNDFFKDYEAEVSVKRLMKERKKWIKSRKELIEYKQKVKEAIKELIIENDGGAMDFTGNYVVNVLIDLKKALGLE